MIYAATLPMVDVVAALLGDEAVPCSASRPCSSLCVQKSYSVRLEGGELRAALRLSDQADLISIFFCCCCIVAVFGSVIVSTPFEKSAAILSRSTLAGSSNERWNDP